MRDLAEVIGLIIKVAGARNHVFTDQLKGLKKRAEFYPEETEPFLWKELAELCFQYANPIIGSKQKKWQKEIQELLQTGGQYEGVHCGD